MECEVVGCKNEADPRLVHTYSGKSFCLSCARQINGWNSKEDVIPIPEDMPEENHKPLAIPLHPVTGMFVRRQNRIEGS